MENSGKSGYTTVTELPGSGATREQLAMMYTRYRMARAMAKGRDVLELGCGPGIGLGYLARQARRVVGGEYDPKLVAVAQQHYGQRLEILQMDAQNLPFDAETFDVVLLLEAIYYLPDASKFIAEARRVLRPGGILFICSANREWTSFNPSPFSHRYFSASELHDMLTEAGFTVETCAGFPAERRGIVGTLLSGVRQVAVALGLIPKTMRGKELVKRLVYGRLLPLPKELAEEGEYHEPLPMNGQLALASFKVVYVVGKKDARTGEGG